MEGCGFICLLRRVTADFNACKLPELQPIPVLSVHTCSFIPSNRGSPKYNIKTYVSRVLRLCQMFLQRGMSEETNTPLMLLGERECLVFHLEKSNSSAVQRSHRDSETAASGSVRAPKHLVPPPVFSALLSLLLFYSLFMLIVVIQLL